MTKKNPEIPTLRAALDRIEKQMVSDALRLGSDEEAATRLGVLPDELQRLIEKHGLRLPSSKECPLCQRRSESFLPNGGIDMPAVMDGIEKQILVEALEKCRNNKKNTAQFLGIAYHTMNYLAEKHNVWKQ
jgi:DNA-binding NtrC family response regulator